MGAVAQAVGDFVGDVVFEPVKQIGNIASDIVSEVGNIAQSVGQEIGKIGEAALNDPIGTIAKVAAVATQQYWALPLISAATVVANGGDLGQAALAAGISYAAGAIAAGVGDALSAGSTATVNMMSADAVSLAQQGLSASQITDVLAQSYGVSQSIATQAATQSIMGAAAGEIAKDISSQMATQNLLAGAAGNAVGSAGRVIASGGDFDDALMGGLTAGAGSLAGGFTNKELRDLGVDRTVAGAIGKATGAAAASTVGGRDAKLSFINSLIDTSLGEIGDQATSGLRSAWEKVNQSATSYNEGLNKTKEDYESRLSPLELEAKNAQEAAAETYGEYETTKEKFDSLVAEYNAAKDAGDTDLANSLADQANELIPQLDDVISRYNKNAELYDEKLGLYSTAAEEYQAELARLSEIKSEYDLNNEELQRTTQELTETGLKVADMSDSAKTAFSDLYNSGVSLTDAFDTVSSLDLLSDPAKEAFLRVYDENSDPTASLDFANQINELGENELSAYSTAVGTGLDDASAMQLAPNLSGMGARGQNAYLDALRNGADEESASIAATLAELFGDSFTMPDSVGDNLDSGDYNGVDYGNMEEPSDGSFTLPDSVGDNLDSGDYNGVDYDNMEAPSEDGTGIFDTVKDALSKVKVPELTAKKTPTRWTLPKAPTAPQPSTSAPAPTSANRVMSMPDEMFGGIKDLAPGLTAGSTYELSGVPDTSTTLNTPTTAIPIPGQTKKMDYTLTGLPQLPSIENPIPTFSTGGTIKDPFNTGVGKNDGISSALTPGLTKAQLNYVLTGMPGSNIVTRAEGGSVPGHDPQFYSEGGLSSMDNRYVAGEGDGTSDSVPAMLANGEFVIPADVVSSLGNGSNEAGASVLDQFLATIRDHKHSKGSKGLPPDSKGPLSYLTDAKRKAKA
jgi:hypothetical protein